MITLLVAVPGIEINTHIYVCIFFLVEGPPPYNASPIKSDFHACQFLMRVTILIFWPKFLILAGIYFGREGSVSGHIRAFRTCTYPLHTTWDTGFREMRKHLRSVYLFILPHHVTQAAHTPRPRFLAPHMRCLRVVECSQHVLVVWQVGYLHTQVFPVWGQA